MEWKYLRQGKGQNVQSFIKEFRKQALNLGISLDSPKGLTKCISALNSYIRYSLLLFEPTTIDVTSLKDIHLESRGKNDKEEQPNKSSFKPHNGKFKGKGKGKDKKAATIKKEEEANSSCTHWKKEGHDDEHCWKLHPKLKPKRFGWKNKQNTVEIAQQNLGSNSSDETLITAVGTQCTLSLHANENYELHESSSSSNESLINE